MTTTPNNLTPFSEKVDLNTCVQGQRVKTRVGDIGTFSHVVPGTHSAYPYMVCFPKGIEMYSRHGSRNLRHETTGDILEILPEKEPERPMKGVLLNGKNPMTAINNSQKTSQISFKSQFEGWDGVIPDVPKWPAFITYRLPTVVDADSTGRVVVNKHQKNIIATVSYETVTKNDSWLHTPQWEPDPLVEIISKLHRQLSSSLSEEPTMRLPREEYELVLQTLWSTL